jgi:hypothetical protein
MVWSATRPCHFNPGERVLSARSMGGWVGPGVGLSAVKMRKFLHYLDSNPGRPAHSPLLYRLSFASPATDTKHYATRPPVPVSQCTSLWILITHANFGGNTSWKTFSMAYPRHKWEDNIKLDQKHLVAKRTELNWLNSGSNSINSDDPWASDTRKIFY